jgi:hypothetical protein
MGYALDAFAESGDEVDLFVGAEGTLGIVTTVEWRLDPIPPHRAGATLGFATLDGLQAAVTFLATLRPDEQVDLVARLREGVEGISHGVLARLREGGGDETAAVGIESELRPGPGSPPHPSRLAVRPDDLESRDPRPDAAVAHRPGAGGMVATNAAGGGERAGRGLRLPPR